MTARKPPEIARLAVEQGASKAHQSWDMVLVAAFLAGAYIAFGGVIGDAGGDPASTGTMTYERLASIAETKGHAESPWQVFLRAVGCNWLVCLAVWLALAGESVADKILAIFGWDDTLVNWLFAGIGNLAGAVIFVATSYWYLYLRGRPEEATAQ